MIVFSSHWQNVGVVDPSDNLVCAQQLQLDTSQRADMLPLRYEKIVTCMTDSVLIYLPLLHIQLLNFHSPLLL